jgi:hypothetical protein
LLNRLAPLSLVLALALVGAQPSRATNVCDRADVALFNVRGHERIAIHVGHLFGRQRVEFDGPGFHRVRHANRHGRALLRVRPRSSGKADVTVECNEVFRVRVTELED